MKYLNLLLFVLISFCFNSCEFELHKCSDPLLWSYYELETGGEHVFDNCYVSFPYIDKYSEYVCKNDILYKKDNTYFYNRELVKLEEYSYSDYYELAPCEDCVCSVTYLY